MAKSSSDREKEDTGEDQSFKHIVRIARSDIDGHALLAYGLTSVKGIGFRLACVIADSVDIARDKRIGDINDEEEETLADFVENEIEDIVPGWMLNRKKDPESGDDLHIVGSEVDQVLKDDIDRLKKIGCYRGIRHAKGRKVRGQRTKSNSRKGLALGVRRKKVVKK